MRMCDKLQDEFKIDVKEMKEIMDCIGNHYMKRIEYLERELETYKMQVRNLLKEKDKR